MRPVRRQEAVHRESRVRNELRHERRNDVLPQPAVEPSAFRSIGNPEHDPYAGQPEQRKRRQISDHGGVVWNEYVRRPEVPRIADEAAARPQNVPHGAEVRNRIQRMTCEGVVVKPDRPARTDPPGERHDPLVRPGVDDAVHPGAALARDAKDLEGQALETGDDDHSAAACDHTRRRAAGRDRLTGCGQSD